MKQCPKCNAQYSNDQAICPIDAGVLVDLDAKDNQANLDPMIGRLIADKYRVEKLLGRGGMGAVYEGQHLLLDRRVAIKVLQQNMANDEQAASRFIREAKASARIEHPNAVTIYDFGVLQEGSAYLVMEFIKGFSLRQMLIKKENLRSEQIADWMIQVCSVVEAAHQQGIIHRDLKPENVMLKESPDGSIAVKVVDFGLAKLTSESTADKASAHLTKPGEMLGTPHYMAPEYYEGETIDARADIYAIGIMMYELFCGDTPFTGTVQSIIGGHLFKDPLPIIKTNPTIHPALDEVVQKALKKNRSERISSASELSTELKQALQEAKELFSQKTAPKKEPLAQEELVNAGIGKQVQERRTIDNEGELLKTERVVQNPRSTVKVSNINIKEILPPTAKPTQQMSFGTMHVGQEFVDGVKENQTKGVFLEENTKNKQSSQEMEITELDVIDLEPIESDSSPEIDPSSFTSAPTQPQPQPQALKPSLIVPPTAVSPIPAPRSQAPIEIAPVPSPTPAPSPILTPSPSPAPSPILTSSPSPTPSPVLTPSPSPTQNVSNTIPATRPVPSLTPANAMNSSDTIPATIPNIPTAQTNRQLAPEYENFSEALAAIKMQLFIGSIIIFLLAIMVTLLIIYRFETI